MPNHGPSILLIKGICLLLILVFAGTSSYGQDQPAAKSLTVMGTAVIHAGDLADGKRNAVNNALVTAVGQVVMGMLTDETLVRRFQIINERFLVQPGTYVQNYRVLAESVSGTMIRTLVRVDVAVDRVSHDLSLQGLATANAVYPRILFMVAEKNVSATDFTYWWGSRPLTRRTICEGAMEANFRASGFEILDPPDLPAPVNLALRADKADMLALAGRLGADVLILGDGIATAAPNTMEGSIKAFEAVVTVQAFDVQTAETIGHARQKAVVSAQDEVTGGRDALSGAGDLAAADLIQKVTAAWQQHQNQGAVIEVAVEGTGGHIANFVRLRTAIATLSGVTEMTMKTMSADHVIMTVHYQGTAQSLADALLLKTFSGFSIDIFAVTPAAIRIRIVYN